MTDVAIIGGGLAGLINAILLSRNGLSVVLFEKRNYPSHKVCGEYISNEVLPFLIRNELFPEEPEVSRLSKFILSSTNGRYSTLDLGMGGFGISRHCLDHFLYKKAIDSGVDCRTDTSVENVEFLGDHFEMKFGKGLLQSKLAIGAFGKRTNLDKKLNREFITARSPYIGVKYHIKTEFPGDSIALHNFKDGYCGISMVENDTYNLCYLSHRDNLKQSEDISAMEKNILSKNPFLKSIFHNSEFIFDKPLVINEISFAKKAPVENHILMSGDSAGMITPLCGNGMAMAIHSASILTELITSHWNQGEFDRNQLEKAYTSLWNENFSLRLSIGRKIQSLFGSESTSNLAVSLTKIKPIARTIVSLTHGKEF